MTVINSVYLNFWRDSHLLQFHTGLSFLFVLRNLLILLTTLALTNGEITLYLLQNGMRLNGWFFLLLFFFNSSAVVCSISLVPRDLILIANLSTSSLVWISIRSRTKWIAETYRYILWDFILYIIYHAKWLSILQLNLGSWMWWRTNWKLCLLFFILLSFTYLFLTFLRNYFLWHNSFDVISLPDEWLVFTFVRPKWDDIIICRILWGLLSISARVDLDAIHFFADFLVFKPLLMSLNLELSIVILLCRVNLLDFEFYSPHFYNVMFF